MNEEKCCKDCAFYESRNKFCRRYPPTPITISVKNKKTGKIEEFVVSKYPVISFETTDWCGEFKNNLI
jgi:hypothetical protein